MEPFTTLTSTVAVLPQENIDTDQIIPARFLKTTTRTGLGAHLFADWRNDAAGHPRLDFVLNRPDTTGARILLAGRNFGCGSSREHAAWALEDYGFRAILAPSYGDIFRTNAIKSGLAPIELDDAALDRIKEALAGRNELTVDLESLEISHPDALRIPFEFDAFARHMLINGLDDVARTLQREERIAAYEETATARFDTNALAS